MPGKPALIFTIFLLFLPFNFHSSFLSFSFFTFSLPFLLPFPLPSIPFILLSFGRNLVCGGGRGRPRARACESEKLRSKSRVAEGAPTEARPFLEQQSQRGSRTEREGGGSRYSRPPLHCTGGVLWFYSSLPSFLPLSTYPVQCSVACSSRRLVVVGGVAVGA